MITAHVVVSCGDCHPRERRRPLSRKTLDLNKMSAASFLAYWELPKTAIAMVVRGMALHAGPPKSLKRLKAIELAITDRS